MTPKNIIQPVHPITALFVAAAISANPITPYSSEPLPVPGANVGVVPPALALYPVAQEHPTLVLFPVMPDGIVNPPVPATAC